MKLRKLFQNIPILSYLFVFLRFMPCNAFAQEFSKANVSSANTTQVSYDLDAALLYSDVWSGLSGLAAIAPADPISSPADETAATYRTLGLRHMKMGVQWITPRRLKAFILLRPDAAGTSGAVLRETDTRSMGLNITKSSEIHLLDLYELSVLRDSVTFSVGVRDEILAGYAAYAEVLAFGLEPQGPRKSFGVYLDMPSLAGFGEDGRFGLKMAALNGNDDRHSARNISETSRDEAPAGQTPYWGGALGGEFSLGDASAFGVGVSSTERKLVDGKATENFYELGIRRFTSLMGRELRVAMDVRQFRETFKATLNNVATTAGSSASLTLAAEVLTGRVALLGVRAGTLSRQAPDDIAKAVPARGLQAEVGMRAWLGEGMEASGIVTREWCKGKMQGNSESQQGCFGEGDNRRVTISRVAFQLSYRTGGSL